MYATHTDRAVADQALTIVGIGASAGGLEAFHTFFANMPGENGMAFVVVLHLPANRNSMLAEIIGRWTGMRVVEVADGQVVEANHVYIPPPHATTTYRDGRLHIRTPDAMTPREDRPVDSFFDTLATGAMGNAVGIVLSGTGTDGALGLKSIRSSGGITLVQGSDGTRPQYDGMPSGAIATGAVDLVASAEDLPGHLIRMLAARAALEDTSSLTQEEIDAARLDICNIIREQLGHDFSGYKEKTFLRRVQRRMQVVNLLTLSDYISRLREDHDEVVMLFRDLLIRVTSFFRDESIFKALEQKIIPRLFRGKHADGTVRVWVPGCATGEEAYSIAIQLREYMDGLRGPPRVQVFATDIDEPAIATARAGRYPATLLEGLSAERRQRFFTPMGGTFVVSKEIRELCTFSAHSLVRDPPFSRLDMISCRNLLIYLDSNQQGSIIPAFHRSLLSKGILLLGSSETTSQHEELFTPIDKGLRIFERRDVRSPPIPISGRLAREGAEALAARSAPAGTRPLSKRDREGVPDDGDFGAANARRTGAFGDQGKAGRMFSHLRNAASQIFRPGREADSLRRLLSNTRTDLQSITEEHETVVEELRSANEELHSVNEELQSTNEELETSKEELQSVNEELQTVNAQLSEKVDELDRANSDIRNLFESTEVATIFLDRHMIIRGYTPAVASIYNLIPSDHGRPLTDIASRLRYDGLRGDVQTVLRTLQPMEHRVTRSDGRTHYIMRVLPYRAPDSTVDGTLVTFVDVTSMVEAEAHQRLLVDELNHRVKNMLTVVISLASQTLRRSATLDVFSEAFMGRVRALTTSYTLLSSAQWQNVPLRAVLLEEIKPFLTDSKENVSLTGPEVLLGPQAALALSMAIHELTTNAVKYGALSVPEGHVGITWSVDGSGTDASFTLRWAEQGGPPVTPPEHRGFGMTVIERGFAHELSGHVDVAFNEEGLHATLAAPFKGSMHMQNPPSISPG